MPACTSCGIRNAAKETNIGNARNDVTLAARPKRPKDYLHAPSVVLLTIWDSTMKQKTTVEILDAEILQLNLYELERYDHFSLIVFQKNRLSVGYWGLWGPFH